MSYSVYYLELPYVALTKYKDFFYYGCKHRSMQRGHKCDYKKQIREELLDQQSSVCSNDAGKNQYES